MTECSHIIYDLQPDDWTRKIGVCFKSIYIKNDFQKFVISYENEFRGQPDFKIGDGKKLPQNTKNSPNIQKVCRFWLILIAYIRSVFYENHKLH